jgi:Zn finger protein HypA/HybF involved in hydrogenase expression
MTYFKRNCTKCDEIFQPTGKSTKICNKCKEKDKLARSNHYKKLRENKVCKYCQKKLQNPTTCQTICPKCLKITIKIAQTKRDKIRNDKLS